MKIAYIANARIPTEKAHGYQIAKMCEEWGRAGAKVTLFAPARSNPIAEDVFSYYGLERTFEATYVRCFDFVSFSWALGPLGFLLGTRAFIRALKWMDIPKDTIIYSRDYEIVAAYRRRGYRTVYDAHNFPKDPDRLIRAVEGSLVVANSLGTGDEFRSRGFKDVLVAPNGVDIAAFDIAGNKADFREGLGIPNDAKVATYVGHLYPWKGVDTVIDAASELSDVTFVIAGGTRADIDRYTEIVRARSLSNVILLGHRDRREVPKIMKASDVLLLPNAPKSVESERYTSPLKMFEYMASGIPIVASDLPSLREVLSERIARFFVPGDAGSLVGVVRTGFDDAQGSAARAQAARIEAERYTWDARARMTLEFLSRA